ncbi:DNA polymerase III, delta subunit [Candidatus Kinetoplastibacterium desouzaii TCC079E]|uniref:DNA polymerase III subunit delta n=1 Tax=Candidatus Kinetoplastidibacterium desouzai TCC079E TaxID=1208919 RepID=M1LLW6_9PROT|nr:DNA polymerase III subunit delta [Candidatus Kinetoplastibacterium desouzaii]AGF46727.1 DNA polymerase III, delta subunit [Candidatus Kinetoplastibacterium desouzaii TCC079E]
MSKNIEYKNLDSYLKQKKSFSPVYLIIGSELLLIDEVKRNIVSSFKMDNFIYMPIFIETQNDWLKLLEEIKTISLFEQNRIFDINIINTKPGIIGSKTLVLISEFLKNQNHTIIILKIPKKDTATKNTAWLRSLLEIGVTIDIPTIQNHELPNWIKQRLSQQKQYVDNELLEWIADKVSNNLIFANQEIIKLGLIFPEGYITENSLKNSILLSNSIYSIFDLRESILNSNILKISTILDYLEKENTQLPLILWSIYEDIRIIGIIKETKEMNYYSVLDKHRIFGTHRKSIINYSYKTNKSLLNSYVNRIHEIDLIIKGAESTYKTSKVWSMINNLSIKIAGLIEYNIDFL